MQQVLRPYYSRRYKAADMARFSVNKIGKTKKTTPERPTNDDNDNTKAKMRTRASQQWKRMVCTIERCKTIRMADWETDLCTTYEQTYYLILWTYIEW